MRNSGKKRGVAVAGTAVLALAGLPLMAGTATAATSINAGQAPNSIVLYSQDGLGASTQHDGSDSRVTVVAGVTNSIGGTAVNSVRLTVDGAVMGQQTPVNGLVSFDVDLPDAAASTILVEALDNFGAVLAGDTSSGVAVGTSRNAVHIDHSNFSEVGQFGNGLFSDIVVVRGTSTAGTVNVRTLGPVGPQGPVAGATVSPAGGDGISDWIATVDVGNELTAPGNDVALIRAAVAPNTSDHVVALSVYDQVVTNVTATPSTPVNVPFGNGVPDDTDWTITVTDQKGNPIYGAQVIEADASGASAPGNGTPNFSATDVNGEATVTLNESTMDNGLDRDPAANAQSTFYRVETNGIPGYQNGVDWLVEVKQTNYPQVPTTVTIDNALAGVSGNVTAMDDDETSTVTFTVKDSEGNPVPNDDVLVKVNYTHGAASYVNLPGTTNAQGKQTMSFTPHSGDNEVVTIDAYVNVDGNPNPTAGDAIAATFSIETGESELVWDNGTRHQVLANGTSTEGGTLQLKSGTVLPHRSVAIDYDSGMTPGANAHLAPTGSQPATPGVIVGDSTAPDSHAEARTGANGKVSITLVDPATPTGHELQSELYGASTTGPNGLTIDDREILAVDWLRSLTPATMVIHNTDDNTPDSLYSLLEGADDNLQPGKLGVGYVVARNADGVILSDATIPMKINQGTFVDVSAPNLSLFSPAPTVGANMGEWSSVGKTTTVTTGDDYTGAINGPGTLPATGDRDAFAINIERHEGFDDDGLVNDKVTAGTGSASFEHDFVWNTIGALGGVPLNNGSFAVSLSADQESPVMPKARAGALGHTVTYDVVATDQFGNRTKQAISVMDDTPLADFTTTGSTQFVLDGPAISADADSATNQSLEVELDGQTKSKIVDEPTTSALDLPASIAALYTVTPDDVQTTTAPINWYDLDLAASSFTLESGATGPVPVGSIVNMIATAIDQEGAPIQGVRVNFVRSGPGDVDSDGNLLNAMTGPTGNTVYTFAGGAAGVATVNASFFSGSWLIDQQEAKVSFEAEAAPVAVKSKIAAKNNGKKKDKLTVSTDNLGAVGARVTLYRVAGSGDKVIGTKSLNAKGKVKFKVKDRNGKKKTKYYAVVSATDLTKRSVTKVKKVR